MPLRFLLLLALISSSVFGAGERLIGTWRVDAHRTEQGLRRLGLSDNAQIDRLKTVLDGHVVTYDGSRCVETVGGKLSVKFEYKVVREDQGHITLRCNVANGGKPWVETLRLEKDCYWEFALPFEGAEACFIREKG